MKKTGRIDALLRILAMIEISGQAKIRDLSLFIGYSRTATFRLLRVAKIELGVSVESVRGRGYVIKSWGVLNDKAVVARHGDNVSPIEQLAKKGVRQSKSKRR